MKNEAEHIRGESGMARPGLGESSKAVSLGIKLGKAENRSMCVCVDVLLSSPFL